MATFTQNNPWTQGVDNLAATIGAVLDARNQRLMQEQQAKLQQQQLERQKLADIEGVWQNTANPAYKQMYEAQAQKLGLAPQQPSMGLGNVPQITTPVPTGEVTPESLFNKYIGRGMHPTVAKSMAEKEYAHLTKGQADGTPVKLVNDVSKAYFGGRGYDQLKPEEQQVALQKYGELQGGIAGLKTTGAAEANLDQPLGREAMYYFNPNTLARIKPSVTKRAAQRMGAIIASPEEIKAINDIDQTEGILAQIQEGAKRVVTARNKVEAAGQLAYSKLPTFVQDAQNKRYLETQDAYLGNVARTLGGERGVLTDQDLIRQKNGLPRPGDTIAVRDAKIAFQNEFLKVARSAAKAKLLGKEFNAEEYRYKLNKILDKMDGISSVTPNNQSGTSVGRFVVEEIK